MQAHSFTMFSTLFMLAIICMSGGGAYAETRVAIAQLSAGAITGTIVFTETSGGVHVTGNITGLEAGHYGFHVHELGDTSTCAATGAHFNPDGADHGGREHVVRHVGDLGNVEFVGEEAGTATVDFVDTVISLRGRNSILGRALVLHEQADDLGLGGQEDSLTTGHAGARLACAVIGIKAPPEPWNSAPTAYPYPSLALLLFSIIYVI